MLFRSIRFFFLIFSLAFSSSLFAQDNYQQWVDDITARLDKTSQLLQQGNTDDARTEVQMAYFEVFENLEGPIRINFSAQKSYQMEEMCIRDRLKNGIISKVLTFKFLQIFTLNFYRTWREWRVEMIRKKHRYSTNKTIIKKADVYKRQIYCLLRRARRFILRTQRVIFHALVIE